MTDRGREAGYSAAILLVALLAGTAMGSAWAGLALGLGVIAGRHLLHLSHLARTLARGRKVRPPFPRGLWGTVYEGVGRLRARSRKRKRRLSRFVSRFREAAAAMPDAVVVIGARGRIDWLNPAAGRLLGLERPADVGAMLVERVRDPALAAHLESDDFDRSVEFRSPVDGSKILSVRVARFGRRRQRLVVARNVTRARLADEAAEDFLASASHELRTPLTVLSGFVEELSMRPDRDEEEAEALSMMQEQATRMKLIIDDLLELSRLQLDVRSGEPTRVAVPAMLEAIAAEARALSGPREHAIEVEVDPALEILGDEKLLRSAFSNLVFNAVHHTPARSEIHLRWWRDDTGAHFEVADTGEGIAARHIPRLTERFYRVDESRSRAKTGTGLGLAIVKHAVEAHGADLRIESRAGGGATFTCHFPDSVVLEGERAAS